MLNGKASLISTKLYPRTYLYHFLKFWKKYTTLAHFLKRRLTQKRTETKYTKWKRVSTLVWDFFPHPAVGDIQLLIDISPLIILWFFINTNFLKFFRVFPPLFELRKNAYHKFSGIMQSLVTHFFDWIASLNFESNN